MRTLRLMLLVSLAAALLGCGQKGPLVLPDAQRPHKQINILRPTAKPANPPAGQAPDAAKPDVAPPS